MAIIKRQSSSEQIINYIIGQIENKQLGPGDRLLNERDFSELLGVSRVPLREAICALSLLGILEARQGEGTFVNSYNADMLGRIMYIYSVLDDTSMKDLFEIREIMEADAAKLAAIKATDEDLKTLYEMGRLCETAVKEFEAGNVSGEEVFAAFNNWHISVAQCTHNKFFMQFMDSIRQSARTYHLMGYQDNPTILAKLKDSVEKHNAVNNAIAQHDAEKAYAMMQEHLTWFENELESLQNSKILLRDRQMFGQQKT